MQTNILDIIFKYNFQLIPLRSVINGNCTCGDAKCTSPGKHPLFNYSWKIVASNDRQKIERWLLKYKDINFAVPTGRLSSVTGKYLVVIDIDEEKHELIHGLPSTFCYKTGGGGYHFWYWSKTPVKNSVSLIANKVDVRGTNGYVVIPPSKHVSGKNYELLPNSTDTIADLPEKIAQLLKIKKVKETQKEPKKKQAGEVSETANFWAAFPITKIREMLNAGTKIPEGIRNTTIFRLLSSDRAKGLLKKQDLLTNAIHYRSFCEDPNKLDLGEVEKIVNSVMRYPPYNNSHEKVNETYIHWLEKKGLEKIPFLKKRLNDLDDAFFNALKPGSAGVSLELISKTREEWFKTNGLLQYSNYKPSLLATKLRNMGFDRVRTAKCNLWKINLEDLEKFSSHTETTVELNSEKQNSP